MVMSGRSVVSGRWSVVGGHAGHAATVTVAVIADAGTEANAYSRRSSLIVKMPSTSPALVVSHRAP